MPARRARAAAERRNGCIMGKCTREAKRSSKRAYFFTRPGSELEFIARTCGSCCRSDPPSESAENMKLMDKKREKAKY